MTRRVAVVTGSTSGIGAEIARRLHGDGLAVLVTGRDTARGAALHDELGERTRFVAADLTVDGAADEVMAAALDTFGRLDVVVNNAAIDHTGDLIDVSSAEVRMVFETNAVAAVAVLAAGARRMVDGGSIVNISSRLAHIGVPTMSVYSAAKGAIRALTTAAAVELAPRGIRVNAVAPGMTRTPLYAAWLAQQDDPAAVEAQVLSQIPLGRLAEPRDVAAAVSFLASTEAAYLTGTTLPVDGGYTAR